MTATVTSEDTAAGAAAEFQEKIAEHRPQKLASIEPAPQHLRALARANEVRLARADLKRRVGRGEITAAEVILEVPWEAETMIVLDLLMSQRRWGHTRCRKFLQAVPMSEQKTIGTMTIRQRHHVADKLGADPTSPAYRTLVKDMANNRPRKTSAAKKPAQMAPQPADSQNDPISGAPTGIGETAKDQPCEAIRERRAPARRYYDPREDFNPHSGLPLKRVAA